MQEIISKRTYTSKHYDNGDGTTTVRVGLSPFHYKDTNGDLVDIEIVAEDKGDFWAFEKTNHKLYVAKDFSANQLIRVDNCWDGNNHSIKFDPKRLVWVNKTDLSDMQVFRDAQAVQGTISGSTITYTDAFGAGIDYEIVFTSRSVSKNLVINSLASLENPPTNKHKLVLLSKFEGNGLALKAKDLTEWDNSSYYESDQEVEVSEGGIVKNWFRDPAIWDAEDNRLPIKVFWKLHNGALWQGKVLPKQFLVNASFPVRTDTTIDTYGLNSKQVVNDGAGGTYNSACTATAGNNVYAITASALHNIVHDTKSGSTWYIRFADMQFDTSAIPSGATITSASMTMYSASSGGGDADGYNLNFVDNTNNGSISNPVVTGDYDAFDNNPANVIGTNTFANFLNKNANVTTTFTSYSAIATGAGAVTRIGVGSANAWLEQYDGSASDPTATNVIRIAMSSDFPYLDVTYTEGGPTAHNAIFFGAGL